MKLYLPIISSIFLFSNISFANEVLFRSHTKLVNPEALEVELSYSMFSTSSKFDTDGNDVTLESGQSFSKSEFEFSTRYGWSKKLEFRGGIRQRTNTSTDNEVEQSNSGLESYFVGAKYSKDPLKKFSYAFDFQIRNSLYSDPGGFDSSEIVLGDAGLEATVGSYFAYRRSPSNILGAYLGYNIPPNELSNEVLYNIESAWIHTNWLFTLGVNGIKSMNGDTYGDTPSTKPQVNQGISNLYNSINREKMVPYVGLFRSFTRWRAGVTMSQVMAGVSTDKGTEFLFTFRRIGSGRGDRELKLQKFKEYDVEATIIKVSPRGKFVKIDIGAGGDVEKGMNFDVYVRDLKGREVLVASGTVYETGVDWSIIRVLKLYRRIVLKKGFTARGIIK